MKKLTLIVSALALLIGFSQCKKEEITPNSNNEGVFITLTAGYGQQDAKTDFNPTDGPSSSFCWSNTMEYIYVGGSKSEGCIGTLTGTGDGESSQITFSGTITPAAGETELHFFYLGNGSHEGATTLDFSNQSSGTVTDWHIAIGSATYDGTSTSFDDVTLNMAMAIAFFDLSGFGDGNIYLNGNDVYNTATIDYTNGTIRGNSKGYINLGTASATKYVALIPSVETETTLNFNSGSKTGSFIFSKGIKEGKFYSKNGNGSALEVSASDGSGIPGTFSVSATKKVFFSKGNLQYSRATTSDDWSTGVWSFMTNQYDVIETENVSDNYASQTAVSLFGWATSGYNLRNTQYGYYYKPFQTVKSDNYGPSGEYSITGDNALGDWGVYNSSKITNGDGYNTWRVMTIAEWEYVLNERQASTINSVNNARFAKAKVGEIYGIILFPDNYSQPNNVTSPVGINDKTGNHWTNATSTNNNIYSTTDWEKMEENGAVFLPASGSRSAASVSYYNTNCYYWSSNNYSTKYAYRINVSSTNVVTSGASAYSVRSNGLSVRLVRE